MHANEPTRRSKNTCKRRGSILLNVFSSWHIEQIKKSRNLLQRMVPPTISVTYIIVEDNLNFKFFLYKKKKKKKKSKGRNGRV
jgi:hypothetical protein